MASAISFRRIGIGSAAVVAAAGLLWFGTGLMPKWPLLWFAPVPVLLFAARNSWRSTAFVATLAWLSGSLNLWNYFGAVLQLPLAARLPILLFPALLFAGSVLLFRALILRGATWSAILAFPAMWVSVEYLFNLTSPHGTAGSLSYSQLNFLPVLQLASVTGPWGISFLLLFFAATLTAALDLYRKSPKRATGIAGIGLGLVGLVLICGAVRLTMPMSGQKIRVGLIASDLPENVGVPEGANGERLFHDYAARVEALAAQGAQIVVLPEKLAVLVDPDTRKVDALFQSLADKTRSEIVVGMVRVSAAAKFNEARVYSPEAPVKSYDKHHLLPPFESNLQPGATLTFLREPYRELGVTICKDMDFTPLSRQYGRAGAGLLLVPAWDFVVDRWAHGHIAVMRGVEEGFSVARAAKQGYLTVSDDRGRILAEKQSNSSPFTTLVADVPAAHHTTLYLLCGDWFAGVVLAAFVVTLGQWLRGRTRPG